MMLVVDLVVGGGSGGIMVARFTFTGFINPVPYWGTTLRRVVPVNILLLTYLFFTPVLSNDRPASLG